MSDRRALLQSHPLATSAVVHLGVLAALAWATARSEIRSVPLEVGFEPAPWFVEPESSFPDPEPAPVVRDEPVTRTPRLLEDETITIEPLPPPPRARSILPGGLPDVRVMNRDYTRELAQTSPEEPAPDPWADPPLEPALPVPPVAVESDRGPELLEGAPPAYPRSAVRRGQEGTVVCLFTVDCKGRVQAVTVRESSGHRLLDEAACEAILTWRFSPAIVDGVAASDQVLHRITFELDG
ncbi:energy transducer TonB [Engelhardtia mirabilis]|uniref:Transport protein TonB n=1 Tax=Engelhardtia mirabilis TaxID=2528011 RepID=A0A518BJD0_9BACT|nr:transport protein TonB [Planctomycetes bacterium Pla133]QDV01414.1 transport protein TonB [Planctomycetes bacterium Pla86]